MRRPILAVIAAGLLGGCLDRPGSGPPPDPAAPAASREVPGGRRPAPGPGPVRPVRRIHPFVDIAAEAGLRFRHETGGAGEKYLPEAMGSGGGFLDYDGDGRLDIFLVNSDRWPGGEAGPRPRSALYRSAGSPGEVRYEDVTDRAGVGKPLRGMGFAAADADGDGRTDIYITALGDNVLYRNRGDGTFVDDTARAGVAGGTWTDRRGIRRPDWSTSALWADLDLDGDLDLLVASYVRWSPEIEMFTTLDGVAKAITTPEGYEGETNRLYLGKGDGTFADATEGSGIDAERARGKSLGMALWDFDADGKPDIVAANNTRPNLFFHNQGGGKFRESGLEAGIAYDSTGRARAGMGIDVADWSNDGVPGVAIGNTSEQPLTLYRWIAGGSFEDIAERARLAEPTYLPVTFGVLFADYDLDGWQDLVLANGHMEPEIDRFLPTLSHAQRPLLLRNAGDGGFDEATDLGGPGFEEKVVGRGLAAGDLDGDGDLDLLITACGGKPLLLRNDGPPPGSPGGSHYLRVRLRGKGKNTAALGATVTLRAAGMTQVRMARTGSSYLSESEPTLTFGLGGATAVESLTVLWPLGKLEEVEVPGVDRTIEVVER